MKLPGTCKKNKKTDSDLIQANLIKHHILVQRVQV